MIDKFKIKGNYKNILFYPCFFKWRPVEKQKIPLKEYWYDRGSLDVFNNRKGP